MAQEKSREYQSKLSNSADISVGDEVLLRQNQTDKLSSNFQPEPGQIISKQGSEVVVRSKEGTEIRRNVSNVKPIHGSHPNISPGDQSVTHGDRPVRERRPIERYGNLISY